MIRGLTSYPSNRESGVAWLGEVPAYWEVKPGRACFFEKKEPNTGLKETTVLSLSFGKIVVKPAEKLHGLVPESFETYQIIDPGDIIIRPTDLQNDWNSLRFALSSHRGIITSAYLCFHTKEVLDRRYGHLLLHTYDLKKVFYGLGSGLRQNLDWSDFKYLPCVVPPLPEQATIIRYIERADRRIRRAVHTKRKLIALLNEEKQAIVHRAVTRGLDPDVPLKPSGVEWLGDVPAHWDIKNLKQISPRISGRLVYSPAQYFSDEGIPFLFGTNITEEGISFKNVKLIPPDINERFIRHALREGDLVTVRVGAPGLTAVVTKEADGLNCASLMIIRKGSEFSSRWLMYSLNSNIGKQQVEMVTYGAALTQINITDAINFQFPVPPLPEQNEIAEYLEKKSSNYLRLMKEIQGSIDVLLEFRTRLIADVVTGRLDVRRAADGLPDEADEPTLLDETEVLDEEGIDTEEEADE